MCSLDVCHFVCLCVCAQQRDVIIVMTSSRHPQIVPVTSPSATLAVRAESAIVIAIGY